MDVSRGYLKIEGAARAFNFDFKDKVVLDIGSSTGGFTEYALAHGAKKVIAVEKGSHQMKAPLRFDPRIDLHEKTDIFDVIAAGQTATVTCPKGHKDLARAAWELLPEGHATVAVWPMPDIILADVSFLSLTKILSYAKKHLAGKHTEFLVMLKPQFEARPDQLHSGVVKNETIRREIIKQFEYWLKQNGYLIIKKHDNELHGKNGNIERFYNLGLAK
ncbi:TlyA family rRNA (cytidine-2'-O)-methyltransferase [Candidatus Saccharibacteria bacterium]|nr:TlyA family rRNA (cytidine-2'-O)-methyltransferase [Candidatus Saccharibacteria bacterium]